MDKIKSLVEAHKEFATQEKCEEYLEGKRWPNGVTCPRCGSKAVTYMVSRRQWQCECRYQFSVTAGTVFHRTHIDLPRWLMAVWLMCYSPKGISGKQIQRELGVTYKTAWYMAKRIRKAMKHDIFDDKLCGIVEVDATAVKADGATGRFGTQNVLGMAERHGALRMVVIDRLTTANIQRVCLRNFDRVEMIYSDAASSMDFLSKIAKHRTVAHYWEHAHGKTHTNYVENAWSLFKRGLIGVFHHVSAKCLQEYLDEFAFRCSHRKERAVLVDLVLANC
jgi:transposase-like protein